MKIISKTPSPKKAAPVRESRIKEVKYPRPRATSVPRKSGRRGH